MPLQSIEHAWYPWGWCLRADPVFETRASVTRDGSTTRVEHTGTWDIYLSHVDGSRIPPGPNLYAGPDTDSARLANVVEKSGKS